MPGSLASTVPAPKDRPALSPRGGETPRSARVRRSPQPAWPLPMLCLCLAFGLGAAELPDPDSVIGAQVDESLVGVTYHVDGTNGDDGNDGHGPADALASIAAAWSRAKQDLGAGTGVRIRIHPGVYRASLGAWGGGASEPARSAVLVIEGTDRDAVEIRGSEIFASDGWTHLGDGLYRRPWPAGLAYGSPAGTGTVPKMLGHRRELLIVDGVPLRQVLLEDYAVDGSAKTYTFTGAYDPATVVVPGTFGITERETGGDQVYVRLADGRDPAEALVEWGRHPVFAQITGKHDLVFRDLTLTHFVGGTQAWSYNHEGVLYFPKYGNDWTRDLLIERLDIRWNNNMALNLNHSDGVTVRDCRLQYNGWGGISGHPRNIRVVDVEANCNNWRGFWGDRINWYVAGSKTGRCQDGVWERFTALGNLSAGLWFDVHAKNITVRDLVSCYNRRSGLFFEISYGPLLAERVLAVHNGEADFLHNTTGECTVRDSIFYAVQRPGLSKFGIENVWFERTSAHWNEDPFEPGHLAFRGNVFAAEAAVPLQWKLSHNPDKPGFEAGYSGADNCWWNTGGRDTQSFTYGTWSNQRGDVDDWLAYIDDQEVRASWRDPRFVGPLQGDFRLHTDSPLAARAGALPTRRLSPAALHALQDFWDWAGYDYRIPGLDDLPRVAGERSVQIAIEAVAPVLPTAGDRTVTVAGPGRWQVLTVPDAALVVGFQAVTDG